MPAISFDVQFDDQEARERLRALVDRIDRPKSFFSEVGQKLAASTRERFRTELAPDGSAWTPLHPMTIKARMKRSRAAIRILSERGYLAGSIRHEASDQGVKVGSVLKDYSAIHQLGGTIDMPARSRTLRFRSVPKAEGAGRRFAKKTRKKGVTEQTVSIPAYQITIPARPFLGISANDQEDIFEAAERWLTL
ncbi:phage virion morphogenesis protein [Paracoccus sp. p3-h83]|uniref:phage virion morphogenesis protein n=1 Tax=Paracoccus sp. p3-h83 TaxID=3342805 RepID=UPI0035BB9536